MNKKIRIASAALLTGLMMTSVFSINFDAPSALAKSTQGTDTKEKIAFFSQGDLTQTLNFVKNSDKDDSLKEEKAKISSGQLLIDSKQLTGGGKKLPDRLDDVTALAYPVEAVKKDANLRAGLHEAIQQGKRVYLFGGVTYDEYKELLGLNEISVTLTDDNGKKSKIIHGDRDKAAAEKGKLKHNPEKVLTDNEDKYDIIGYTLDGHAQNQLFVASITAYNNKQKSKANEDLYMREILDNLTYVIEQTERSKEQQQPTTSMGFFNLNTATAATNVIVKTAPQRYVGSIYDGGALAGKTITDWNLEQNKNETDGTYDFFLVKDSTEIYEYNGYWAKELWTDHDIPYDSDYIQDWGPNDSSSSPYSITIGFPWTVTTTFNMSSDPQVDEMGSLASDFGRWETSVFFGSLDGDVFKAWTGWKSTGTYATMDIREKGTFVDHEGFTMTSSILIDVTYDYE